MMSMAGWFQTPSPLLPVCYAPGHLTVSCVAMYMCVCVCGWRGALSVSVCIMQAGSFMFNKIAWFSINHYEYSVIHWYVYIS